MSAFAKPSAEIDPRVRAGPRATEPTQVRRTQQVTALYSKYLPGGEKPVAE